MENAEDVLGLHLFGMEEDNDHIPEPTPIEQVKLQADEKVVWIEIKNMEKVRNDITQYMKKLEIRFSRQQEKLFSGKDLEEYDVFP